MFRVSVVFLMVLSMFFWCSLIFGEVVKGGEEVGSVEGGDEVLDFDKEGVVGVDTGKDLEKKSKLTGAQKVVKEKKVAYARLFINVNWKTHEVSINGVKVNEDYFNRGFELKAGVQHKVRIKVMGGSVEKTYKILLKKGDNLNLTADLTYMTAVPNVIPDQAVVSDAVLAGEAKEKEGFLSVTCEVNAQVYVDGRLASSKTPLEKYKVSEGSHSVKVYFIDTRRFSKIRDLYVAADAHMSVHFGKDD